MPRIDIWPRKAKKAYRRDLSTVIGPGDDARYWGLNLMQTAHYYVRCAEHGQRVAAMQRARAARLMHEAEVINRVMRGLLTLITVIAIACFFLG